jgi:hypothetical protein
MVAVIPNRCVYIFVTAALIIHICTAEAALILHHKWAKFRNLPQYNINKDPLRRNLRHGVRPANPSSCHFYLIDSSCRHGPKDKSVVCVECAWPSRCNGKESHNFRLLLQGCGGYWTPIAHKPLCQCKLIKGNYIFI